MAATLGQAVALTVIAMAVALGSNELRGKNRINLARDYSARPLGFAAPARGEPPAGGPGRVEPGGLPRSASEPGSTHEASGRGSTQQASLVQAAPASLHADTPNHTGTPMAAREVTPLPNPAGTPNKEGGVAAAASPEDGATIEGIKVLSFEQVKELHASAETLSGVNVFVDARNDEAYQAGHLPCAMQCDFYRIEHYLPQVLECALVASRVIVYCNGGQCEDSLLVCGELLRGGVPRENIYLYKAGYEVWVQQGMPVKTGTEAQ